MLAEGVIKAKGGKEDYAWCVWARDHRGPTTCDWILLPDAKRKLQRKRDVEQNTVGATPAHPKG